MLQLVGLAKEKIDEKQIKMKMVQKAGIRHGDAELCTPNDKKEELTCK